MANLLEDIVATINIRDLKKDLLLALHEFDQSCKMHILLAMGCSVRFGLYANSYIAYYFK